MLRTVRRHLRDNFVAYVALLVALGGTGAFAATSIVGSDGQLNGCVTKNGTSKGTLRVVAAGTRCRRSEQAIAWSQRGPQGAVGVDGARGADGATGPPGSPDTASQVLEKVKQADGAGSALDSDLLDGHDTSFFQRRGSSTACTGTDKATGIGTTGDLTCAGDNTTPSGTASGDLAGTYPNPTLAPFPQITLFGTIDCGNSAPFQPIANNVETTLAFRNETSGSWPANDSDPCTYGTKVIKAPRTGTYLISAGMLWPVNSTGQRGLAIDIDGIQFGSQRGAAATTGDTHTNVTTLARLVSGQPIQVKAFQSSGISLEVDAEDDYRHFFSAIWLGPN